MVVVEVVVGVGLPKRPLRYKSKKLITPPPVAAIRLEETNKESKENKKERNTVIVARLGVFPKRLSFFGSEGIFRYF